MHSPTHLFGLRFFTRIFGLPFLLILALAMGTNPASGQFQDPSPVRVPLVIPGENPAPEQRAQERPMGPLKKHIPVVVTMPEEESDISAEIIGPYQPPAPGDGSGSERRVFKGTPYRLAFAGGDYRPPANERIDPQMLRFWQENTGKDAVTYGFVMFQGRITAAKENRVRKLGVILHKFHTYQSYKATIPATSIPLLGTSKDVRWIGYARPEQKLSLSARAGLLGKAGERIRLYVQVFACDLGPDQETKVLYKPTLNDSQAGFCEGAITTLLPHGPAQLAFEKLGAKVLSYYPINKIFKLEIDADKGRRLTDFDFVHGVDLVEESYHCNDNATRMTGVDMVRTNPLSNGSSVVVGILDSGVDTGHDDFGPGRGTRYYVGWNYSTESGTAFNDNSGHGTRVMGSFVGAGLGNPKYMGCAPGTGKSLATRMFVAKILPGDRSADAINKLRYAYSSAPRPHVVNNSWSTGNGANGTAAKNLIVDASVYNYGQCYVFAAGNAGGYGGNEKLATIRYPNDSKNALAVGNVYPKRKEDLGYQINTKYLPDATYSIPANSEYAYPVTTATNSTPLQINGIFLFLKASKTTTVYAKLYRANSTGKVPSGPPLLTVAKEIDATWKNRLIRFDSTYQTTPGTKYFISIKAGSIGVIRPTTGLIHGPQILSIATKAASATNWVVGLDSSSFSIIHQAMTGQTDSSSSKGPTNDSRLKPEICAPGSSVMSCTAKTKTGYSAGGGTSQAAPFVSGIATTLIDRYSDLKYKPAGIKAVLTATANVYDGLMPTYTQTSEAYCYRQGFGQVDATKAQGSKDGPAGWVTGYSIGSLGSNQSGAYIDINVPSDAEMMTVALSFVEESASINASRACIADLDLYIQYGPLDTLLNTGQYNSTRNWDTCEWFVNKNSITNLRGKTIRLKVHSRVRPGVTKTVNYGIAYCIARGKPTSRPTLTLSAPKAMNSSQLGTLTGTVSIPEFIGLNGTMVMWDKGGCDLSNLVMNGQSGNRTSTTGRTNFTFGQLGYWYTLADRTFSWKIQKAAVGVSYITVRFYNSQVSYSLASRRICIDNSRPDPVTLLQSSSHTAGIWSREENLSLSWAAPKDYGCAGVKNYKYEFSLDNPKAPLKYEVSALTLRGKLDSTTRKQYFNIRAQDEAGNTSFTRNIGPFYIDAVPPTLTSVTLNGGAKSTNTLNATLVVNGSDPISGVSMLRYSMNNSTWSPWQAVKSSYAINLGSYGGSSLQGTKRCYVRIRDRAGNESATVYDYIIYDTTIPVIQSVDIASGKSRINTLTIPVTLKCSGAPATYRWSMNGSTWSPWYTYSSSFSAKMNYYGGNTNQGLKTVYVVIRDGALNMSAPKTDTIYYDTTPPNITSLMINKGVSATTSLKTEITLAASGLPAEYRWSMNGTTWSTWAAYATSFTAYLNQYGGTTAPGLKTIRVTVRDLALNNSSVRSDSITYSTTAPAVTSVVINSGALYTRSLTNAVKLTATGSPTQYRWSMNGTTWSAWTGWTGSFTADFRLYGGNTNQGIKTVSVMARNAALTASAVRTDTITYDNVAPVITLVSINSGASTTNSLTNPVSLAATGSPTKYRWSMNGTTWSPWINYAKSFSANLSLYGGNTNQGFKRILVMVCDGALNLSSARSDSITYALSAPVITLVQINAGASSTTSLINTVKQTATGSPTQYRWSMNGTTWSAWTGWTGSFTADFRLYGGNTNQEVKRVSVMARNAALTPSAVVSDTITYGLAPALTLVSINSGASTTNSLTNTVSLVATGSPTRYRWSMNGLTWSPWATYTKSFSANLSYYGGNTNQGVKTISVVVSDAALNISKPRSDSINYALSGPVITSLLINSGASTTTSLINTVSMAATGSPTQYRWSMNGLTWSAWTTYTKSFSANLSHNGGNSNPGVKTISIVVRNAALINSKVRTDSITYSNTPIITGLSVSTVNNVAPARITITGSNFKGVTRVDFGSRSLGAGNINQWLSGYYRYMDYNTILLYPPQGLAAGVYLVSVRVGTRISNGVKCVVQLNGNRQLGLPATVKVNNTLHLLVARGNMPTSTTCMLTLSVTPTPLSLPGLLTLGHGGNPLSLIDPSFMILNTPVGHDPVTGVAKWSFPAPLQMTLYFQALMIDMKNPMALPIRTSTAGKVVFN